MLFATVSIALFMGSIDQTITATALGAIDVDLNTTLNWGGWTLTIYSIGRIIVTALVGPLDSRLGAKQVFICSVALFTFSSFLCAVSSNILELVLARAAQALGGGAFVPSATGLIANNFGRNRDRAVGMFSSIVPLGAILGPIVGGLFVTYWTWRGIFLINIPLGVLVIAAGAKFIPGVQVLSSERVDIRGAALLVCSLLSTIMALTFLGEPTHSPGNPIFLTLIGFGLISAFLLWRRSSDPGSVLPRDLLRGRGYSAMNILNLVFGASALGLSSLVPLYGQTRYGMDALTAATSLTARGIGMIAVAGVATLALRRSGYRLPIALGFMVTSLGLIMLSSPPLWEVDPRSWVSGASLIVGVGMGIALPSANNASLQLDPSRAAAITGLRTTFRQLGAIAAVSVTTAMTSRSLDPTAIEARVFLAFAMLTLMVLPLIQSVPEHRSGW